jgi:hypothetical protein
MLHIGVSSEKINRPAGDGESPLDELARRIRAGRQAIDQSIRNALRVALDVGDDLIEARSRVSIGHWGRWLKANCFLSARSAELYAQLARHRPEIEDALQRIPGLSLRAAARLIAKPAAKKCAEKESKPELAAAVGRLSDEELKKQLPAALPFDRFLRVLSPDWRGKIESRLSKTSRTEAGESFIKASEILRRALSLVKIAAGPEVSPAVAASDEKEAIAALRQLNSVLAGADIDAVTIVHRYAKERRRAA